MTLIWASVLLGCCFGMAARLGSFCLLRGLVQAMERPPAGKRAVAPALQACALALAVALLATQGLALAGLLDLTRTLPMRTQFSPLGMLAGGLLFGIGMALARACAARALVLVAGGNLRPLWVLLWLGLTAQAAMTGVLAPVRQYLQGWKLMTLPQASVTGWVQAHGLSGLAGQLVAVGVPVVLLLAYALWRPALRQRPLQMLAAIVIGLLVAAGWWVSAHVGLDPFAADERPLTSLSFISPVAESWLYLQLAVGRELAAGVALVGGVLAGALVVAVLTGSFRLEGFERASSMLAGAVGGVLMGLGGVVALGCSIGQGLAGLSTLALASLPAVAGIIIGAGAVIQWQQRC